MQQTQQTLTLDWTVKWSANTIRGGQFVGVLEDRVRLPARITSAKEVLIDPGAITTAIGETINDPVGKPAL